jgi:hypothetical protein
MPSNMYTVARHPGGVVLEVEQVLRVPGQLPARK